MENQWIDKIEVATRQIKEAIRLFFDERDFIVIHTIIASAHQILFDIGRKKGIQSMVKNTKKLKGDEIQEFLRKINYPYNFFKHADRDQNSKIDIASLGRLTADFIMDAIVLLQRVCGTIPNEAKIFWHCFVDKYKEEFENLPEDGPIRKMQQIHLSEWNFQKISQLLKVWEVLDANGIPLNNDVS